MLLSRGFVLADIPERVSWRAVMAMVRKPWESGEHLLAELVDAAALLLWSKTEDGRQGRNRPDPITRPGEQDQAARAAERAREVVAAAKAAGLGQNRE